MYETDEQRLERICQEVSEISAELERLEPVITDAKKVLSYPPEAQDMIARARRNGLEQWKEKRKAQREAEAAKAETDRLKSPFVLPEGQEFFSRADMKIWAIKNGLGGGKRNLNEHIKDFRKDKELDINEEMELSMFLTFLFRLKEKTRPKKT